VTPNRRSLLERIAAATVVGLAGCAEDGNPTERPATTTPAASTGGPAATSTESPTPTPEPALDGDAARSDLRPEAGDAGDQLGAAVAASESGRTVLVGAPRDEDTHGSEAGVAYAFSGSDGNWEQAAALAARKGDPGDAFGTAVALSGNGRTAVVGAPGDTTASGDGSAYVFARGGGGWQQVTKLTADDVAEGEAFGTVLALSSDGTTAVVGAPHEDDGQGGATYVFGQTDGEWQRAAELVPAEGGEQFGESLAVSADGRLVLVGDGSDGGGANVYERTGSGWRGATMLTADGAGGGYGRSVAVSADGTVAAVGAPGGEDPASDGTGAVYLYRRSSGGWDQSAKLTPGEGQVESAFGTAAELSSSGGALVVGAPGPEGEAGRVLLFQWRQGTWRRRGVFTDPVADSGSRYGETIALSGDGQTGVIGDRLAANREGITYVYR
jgi:hypothetical protein